MSTLNWVAGQLTPSRVLITRVFNYGTWEEWHAMKSRYTPQEVRDALIHPLRGQWTRRGKAFAQIVYGCKLPDDVLVSFDA